MGKRVPCTPFGKKVKIEMVNQGMAQCELAKRLNLANSTISDILYGRNQCERTKERIAETLGIKG